VTVFFADVVNYTGMSEKLDAEDIHQMIDEAFKIVMDEINRYEGTVMQYTGDGVMAVFGAPLAHEDHSQRACLAALAVQKATAIYAKKVRRVYGLEFMFRLGINSGLVIVGPVGDDPTMDYSALGDTTNVAARLQSLAEPGTILVSSDTHKTVRDFFVFESLGPVAVKGKEKPVEAYKLLAPARVETRLEAAAIKGLTKFVGRKTEIETLKKTFRKAQAGSGQVVGIVGEAGIGKSRLVLEFKNILDVTEDHTFLEGKCLHFGSSIAYLPILDILRSYFNIIEGQGEAVTKARIEGVVTRLGDGLGYVLPPLLDVFSVPVDDRGYMALDPKQKRDRIFEAIRDVLVMESRERCLVIVIDNLLWIDKTSEDFAAYLITSLPATRILLILLYRPEYTHPWANKSYYSGIGIDRLSSAVAPELIVSLLSASASNTLSRLILERAGGNPLFMEELTYSLMEDGHIAKVSRNEFVLSREVSEIKVPDTIQGIVSARVDRLPEHLKHILQIASVIGRDFTVAILEQVSDNGEIIRSHLRELQSLEFIFEKAFVRQKEYKFKHDLVHEVVYNTLLMKKRRKIHGMVAQAVESSHERRIDEFCEILAYHYRKADDLENSYKFLKMSGEKAMRSYSLWEAFRFFREAIDVKGRLPRTNENTSEQITIRLLAASSMISLGFPDDSLKILQEGEELAREIGARKAVTSFCSMTGLYYSVKGQLLEGMEYGEACFATAEQSREIDLMAPIAFDLCSNYAARGEFSKVVALAPKVLGLLEQTGMESESFNRGYNVYSALMAFYGFSTGYMGNVDEGRKACEKSLETAERFENVYSLGLAELLFGHLIAHQAAGQEASAHFRKSIDYLEKGQIFVLLGLAWTGLGRAYWFMGETGKGVECMEKGLKLHTEAGALYNSSSLHCFLAYAHNDLGNIETAREHVDAALLLSLKNRENYYYGLSQVIRGRILCSLPDSMEEAEQSLSAGLKILEAAGSKNDTAAAHLYLAELFVKKQEPSKAFEAYRTAKNIFAETGAVNWLAITERLEQNLRQPHPPKPTCQ
jgi:class 3 adenylate cyclase/tetratricopeptide (TPR) repeat protein